MLDGEAHVPGIAVKFSDPKSLEVKINDPKDLWGEFTRQFNWFFGLVVGALLIGFITILFMVAQLMMEAYRFNSTFYRESSQLKIQDELIQNTVEQQEQITETLLQIKTDIEILKNE